MAEPMLGQRLASLRSHSALVQRGDQLDGHASGGRFPLFDGKIRSQLALLGLAVRLGDVAGHKHECPNARKWYERRDRLRQSR